MKVTSHLCESPWNDGSTKAESYCEMQMWLLFLRMGLAMWFRLGTRHVLSLLSAGSQVWATMLSFKLSSNYHSWSEHTLSCQVSFLFPSFPFLFIFWGRVSLCNLGWHGTHCVDQVSLELRSVYLCLPGVGIEVSHHTWSAFSFQSKLTSNLGSSYLSFLSVWVTGACHYVCFDNV